MPCGGLMAHKRPEPRFFCKLTFAYLGLLFYQKWLEMAQEPRGVCFKLWVIKTRSCCHPSPRLHIGDVLWNFEPDLRHQFSQCFWSALLVFRKMRFWPKSAKTTHPKHPPGRVHCLVRWDSESAWECDWVCKQMDESDEGFWQNLTRSKHFYCA